MKFYSYLFYSLFILSSQFLVASYGNLPFLSNLSLSPDGGKIAAKTYIQGKPVIISMNLLNQPTFEPIASLKRGDDRVDFSNFDPRENGNAIFKVNLNNLRFEKFESSFQDIEGNRVSNFFAENGIIRYATFYDSIEGTQKVYFRNKKDDDWENIFSFSANEISEDDINIIGLDKNVSI